jgi:hypothetical protein
MDSKTHSINNFSITTSLFELSIYMRVVNNLSFQCFEDNVDINWLVTGCANTFDLTNYHVSMKPWYHDNIHLGRNTIGCPTVLTIKNNSDKLYLDETLKFLDDCEYYKRLYIKYGDPHILPQICVGIREGGVSASSLLNDEIRQKELDLMLSTYGQTNNSNKL